MKFHCTVMEKHYQNVAPHSVSVTTFTMPVLFMGHSLQSFCFSLEDATTVKQAPFCSFLNGHLHEIHFAKFCLERSSFHQKPKAIPVYRPSPGFLFVVRKKVMRKVYHLKVLEKRIEWCLFQLHSTFV